MSASNPTRAELLARIAELEAEVASGRKARQPKTREQALAEGEKHFPEWWAANTLTGKPDPKGRQAYVKAWAEAVLAGRPGNADARRAYRDAVRK